MENNIVLTPLVALSPVDELLSGMRGVPETIGMAALFTGEPPPLDALRDRVAERWGELPRLRQVLCPPVSSPRLRRRRRWLMLDRFDAGRQVLAADDADDDADGTELAGLLGRLVARPLPAGVPPWQLRTVRTGGGFAVVLTAHHALLDGRSLERLLTRLLDGDPGRGSRSSSGVAAVRTLRARSGEPARRLHSAMGPGRGLPVPAGPTRPTRSARSPQTPQPPQPDLAWAEVDADAMKAARRSLPGLGASVNEVLLAGAAGALRSVHGEPARWPGAPRPLYASFAVDLRTPEDNDVLGNRVSMVRVPLPVAVGDAHERLAACRGLLAAYGPVAGPDMVTGIINTAWRLGPWALRALTARTNSPRYVPVAGAVMKWPRGTWSLDGRPLKRVVPLPAVPVPGTVGIALTDCGGAFTLCVVSRTCPGHARLLADAFTRELSALQLTARPAAGRS
jgi:hypothetical protein